MERLDPTICADPQGQKGHRNDGHRLERELLKEMPTSSHMQHLAAMAQHDEHARRLLADMHQLVNIIRDAALRDGAAAGLHEPTYYLPETDRKRARESGHTATRH